ncbi:hypothetical protein Tco_0226106 [Tanacetum coccineum]
MEYLPKTIWRQSDRECATAMIQANDKRLKSRRIMRSLERFVDKMGLNALHTIQYYDTVHMILKMEEKVPFLVFSADTPSFTTVDQDAPSTSHSPSSSEVQAPILHQGVAVRPNFEDNPFD